MFKYDTEAPLDIEETDIQYRGGVAIRDITYASPVKGRVPAYLVLPPGEGSCAGIVYAHWYEPRASNQNRTQFLDEAVELADRGAGSILIDMLWARPEPWQYMYRGNDIELDRAWAVQQTTEIRRALDILLSQESVDPARIGFVGHDYGAMCGAILAGIDKRVKTFVLIAGIPRFSPWFLLSSKLEGHERKAYIEGIAPVDPVNYIGQAAPASILFQFADDDFYVPKSRADEFFQATSEPKEMRVYAADHAVDHPQAARDRSDWLGTELGL
jgi:cephalosporin-C deacetylase-like acetyl esterase